MMRREKAMMLSRILVGTVLLLGAASALAADATPRLANGHPDLNGTWDNGGGIDFLKPQTLADGSVCISNCPPPQGAPAGGPPAPRAAVAPDRPKYRPQFQAKVDDLTKRQVESDPVLRCRPPGVPRIGPPDKIVQTNREAVFLYEDVSGPFFRIIPLDGRSHRGDDSESWLGDAAGHWEGDTLVVETGNFNEDTWLTDNGAFHSARLRVTERLRRTGAVVEWTATVTDPEVLAEPWTLRPRRMVLTDVEMAEPAPCFEQDMQHMVDDSYHANPR
jgi:hypothetical protein